MKWTKMSQLREERLNGVRGSRLIICLQMCLCSVAINGVLGQQQPGSQPQQPIRHVLPVGQEIQRIPAPKPMQAPQLNSTSEIATRFSNGPYPDVQQIHPDVMVEQASYEVDANSRHRRNARSSQAGQSEFPWEYQLKHQSYAQFERKLADIWGDRLLCDSLDNEHRMLRIFLPAGKTAPEAPMRFDRVRGVLTYEGAPDRKQGWHQLIQALDRADSPYDSVAVEVVDVGSVDQNFVRQASWIVQDAQDDTRAPDNQDQSEQAIDVIPSPGDLDLSQDVLDRLEQDVPNLKGTVELRDSPETGTLIIIGEDEDVAKVKAYMLKIIAAAKTMSPRTASIPLFNSQPTELATIVQEVYDNQFQVLHGPVDIRPITASNSLFVAGSEGAVEAVTKIVKQFDGEKKEVIPPDVDLTEDEKGYLFYQLKHIDATTAKRVVDEFFGQATTVQPNAPRDPSPVITIVESRSNTLSILAGMDLRNKAKAFLDEIDTPNNIFERAIQVFPIRNQIAGDLAVIVQDILNGGQQLNTGITETQGNLGGNQNFNQQQQQPGSTLPITPITTLQIRARDNTVVDGGILFDARLTSNNASNTIAVVAPEHAMGLIAELIKQLDKLPDVESVVKVFPVINGDAREILSTLQEIFGQGQQGGQQQGAQQQGATSNLPLQSSAASDGSTLLNLTFAVNDRTNTIIATGSESDLDFVDSLIQRLDEEDIQDRDTWIYRLSNAFVLDVATALDDFLTTRQTIFSTNPLTGGGQFNGGVNLSRREVIVVPDESSNSLIINARRNEFAVIEHIIKGLDRLPPMVKVKAMIVAVNLDQMENFGVEFGIQDSSIFEAGLSDTIGTGFIDLENVAGQLETNLAVGRGPGFVLSAGDESLNFLLRFMKQKGCANVLFSPQIMTLENLEARLNVGAQIQRLGQTTNTVQGVTQSIDNVDTGITLAVTPRVMPDGMIVMFVDVQNSALGSEANGTVIGVNANGDEIRSAPINQTAAQTTIMCRSGQTVALSGLISENKSQSITSVPILGDLPVVGPLFQSVRNDVSRTETLIILTPYIVDGPDDINALNEDDFNRMHWCKCDVAEIYGTTSYSGSPYFEQTPKKYYPDNDPTASNPETQSGFQSESLPSPQNGLNQPDAGMRPGEQNLPQNRDWQNNNGPGNQNDSPLMNGGSRGNPTGDPLLDGGSSRSSLPDGQYNRQQIQSDPGAVTRYRTNPAYQQAGNDYPNEVQFTKHRAIAPPMNSPYEQGVANTMGQPVIQNRGGQSGRQGNDAPGSPYSQQMSQDQNAQMAARFLQQYQQERSQFADRTQFQPPVQGQPVESNYGTADSRHNSNYGDDQVNRYGGVSNSYR